MTEPIDLLAKPPVQQDDCPLFSRLPPELRNYVYAYALTDYPDPQPDRQYDNESCYSRPSYFAPRRSDTNLLLTCRAIYSECWFMPFLYREQTHWLAHRERAPPEYILPTEKHRLRLKLRKIIAQLYEKVGDDDQRDPDVIRKAVKKTMEIQSLRVFAQMFMIENGQLTSLLRTPFFFPRRLVITIRHADWWYWEHDVPLRFEGSWIQGVCSALQPSVREICIELETLERKKAQVDSIAQQMCQRWFFKTADKSVTLYSDAKGPETVLASLAPKTAEAGEDANAETVQHSHPCVEVSRWSGRSTWHDHRSTRKEAVGDRIDYYIVAVTFRPEAVILRNGGVVSEEARRAAESDTFDPQNLKLHIAKPPAIRHRFVVGHVSNLEAVLAQHEG